MPEQAKELFADLPQNVRVELKGGAEYSLPEMVRATEEVHLKLYRDPEVATITSYVDEDRQVIEINIEPKNKDRAARADVEDSLSRYLVDIKFPTELTLQDAPQGQDEVETARGGSYLDQTNGTWWCTTGFMVRRRDFGGVGVATADHCTYGEDGVTPLNSMRLRNHDVGTYTTVAIQGRTQNNRDLAYYTRGAYNLSKTFYYNYRFSRTIAGEDFLYPPDPVSNFGRTNGYHRELRVYKNYVTHSGTPDCRITTYVTAGGNRGGPWFYNSDGIGIHSGRAIVDGQARSVYTPTVSLGNSLGVDLYY